MTQQQFDERLWQLANRMSKGIKYHVDGLDYTKLSIISYISCKYPPNQAAMRLANVLWKMVRKEQHI